MGKSKSRNRYAMLQAELEDAQCPPPKPPRPSPQPSAEHSWRCGRCTLDNPVSAPHCAACEQPWATNPAAPDQWTCTSCTYLNSGSQACCELCELPRHGTAFAPVLAPARSSDAAAEHRQPPEEDAKSSDEDEWEFIDGNSSDERSTTAELVIEPRTPKEEDPDSPSSDWEVVERNRPVSYLDVAKDVGPAALRTATSEASSAATLPHKAAAIASLPDVDEFEMNGDLIALAPAGDGAQQYARRSRRSKQSQASRSKRLVQQAQQRGR